MVNSKALPFSLVGLGVLGILLSLIVACLGPFYKSQVRGEGSCEFCSTMSFTVMMVGVVNMIICILPVIIGVCAGKKKEYLWPSPYCSSLLPFLTLVFLGYVFGWASFEYDRIQLSK
eukprot:TRINITY_DN3805_c0_g1_i1.p1 TRINITY_DN3805_c0_g1~~TRINITY_DN3805_c0_g1_i1.p1  ORF type:complete len:117 (+),score=9.69 TRINITY_DN3805_c0_g1_i1:113-463(+)